MLTNRTRASVVQLLEALPANQAALLLLKHFDRDSWPINTHVLLDEVAKASPEGLAGLLVELIGGRTAVRAYAPTKYVFDGRVEELRGRLRADGLEIVEDTLVQLLPAAEPVSHIADAFDEALGASDLDADGEIRKLLRNSHSDLSATPADYNGATTKARITLETVCRRAAASVASRRSVAPPGDTWGAALGFLRSQSVIADVEEKALAAVYSLLSPGAHVPKGLSDEQWALLSRAFAVSGAYFLARQYAVA